MDTPRLVKSKYGAAVRSKTHVAKVNEAMCKVLCHNLCCLIQSTHELGIEAAFWGRDEKPALPGGADPSVDDASEAWAWV